MGFIIEQECPQCGAPIYLSETDRILTCRYCDVQSYLYSPGYFRYILPNKTPEKDIIHIPYLRFKGNVFFCTETTINHRIIDITQSGSNLKGVPVSLGIRPQAMKARFARVDTPGRFMKFSLKAADILDRAAKLTSVSQKEEILHRAFIGETMSIFYLPVYVEEEKLYDAISKKPLSAVNVNTGTVDAQIINSISETVSFIPTLCPDCGATMKGERDSSVLLCDNCFTAWEFKGEKYSNINMIISGKPADEAVYLPFWKICARAKGINIDTFGDFLRLTNQPVLINRHHDSIPMSYFCPAFKIRPKMFINLARQFTIMQMEKFNPADKIPQRGMRPVTLPVSEAVQALKIILASSAVMKKNVMPFLPQITFDTEENNLIYLPFKQTRYDMINEELGISINRQSLEFGRAL